MNKLIKKLVAIVGVIGLAGAVACAQNRSTFAGNANAYDFAFGVNPGSPALLATAGSTGTGTYTVTLAYGTTTTGSGIAFTPITTHIPLTIGTGSNQETVTPSSVSCSTPAVQYTCQFTATFTNAHGNGAVVRSGDSGLQEAATFVVAQGGGLVTLSPTWFALNGGHSAGITFLETFKSLATTTYSVLDWSGVAGALSYAAASGSNYASTTHVIY